MVHQWRFLAGARRARMAAFLLGGLLLGATPFLAGCTEALHSQTVSGSEIIYDVGVPTRVNFPRPGSRGCLQRPEDKAIGNRRCITSRELAIWARGRNLIVMPDCPVRMRDHVAELIDPRGLEFHLAAPGAGRVFLYLDFATYRPLQSHRPYLESEECRTSDDMLYYRGTRDTGINKVHWLEIIVNGRVLKTLYQGGGTYLVSPIAVPVDREAAMGRSLKIRLLPSPGETYFAVWDAFVSRTPPTELRMTDPSGPVIRKSAGQ